MTRTHKTHKLFVPIDPKVWKQLVVTAQSQDVPVTVIVRRAIAVYFSALEDEKAKRAIAYGTIVPKKIIQGISRSGVRCS